MVHILYGILFYAEIIWLLLFAGVEFSELFDCYRQIKKNFYYFSVNIQELWIQELLPLPLVNKDSIKSKSVSLLFDKFISFCSKVMMSYRCVSESMWLCFVFVLFLFCVFFLSYQITPPRTYNNVER